MLRFVPLLADETQAIIDAQTVRGASFKHGSNRLRAVSSILIALLASSLHHADGLLVHLTLVVMRVVVEELIGIRWCIRAEISSQPYCAPPTLLCSRSYPR